MNKLTIGSGYCSIMELYNRIALAASVMPKDVKTYDCKKVCVSPKIQEEVFTYYKEEEKIEQMSISMWWVCYGPKATEDLTNHEVKVEDGWYTLED